MADNEEGRVGPPRGNEWEVVSLTESVYDAASGPKKAELTDDDKSQWVGDDKGETSEALFMSRHFVFPPSQHENLPLEPEETVINNEMGAEDAIPQFVSVEEEGISNIKDGEREKFDFKALDMSDDFLGIQFDDEKGNGLSVSGTEFEELMALHGLNIVDKEQSIYGSVNYSSVHSEATIGESTEVDENKAIVESIVDSETSRSPKSVDDDECNGFHITSESWLKRRAASLYAHAKETNSVWSIFIAAAVLGLVIGQRWQRERWQDLQLKWQSEINDEKMGNMLRPLARLKDVIVGGYQRGSAIRNVQ